MSFRLPHTVQLPRSLSAASGSEGRPRQLELLAHRRTDECYISMQQPLSNTFMEPKGPWSPRVFGNETAPHGPNSFSAASGTTQPQILANDSGQHQDSCVDQPLTRDGRARMRVFIACLPCRKNKRRCDGTRPICSICKRKGFVVPPSYGGSNAPEALKGYCIYDVVPKRRGPDRTPRSRLKRNKQIDDDERPTKRRRTTRDEILKQEPQPCGGVVRPPSPNEEGQSDLLRTIPSQGDRSSSLSSPISPTVTTTGHKWKRQDTEDTTPSITRYRHLQVPPTSVLTPGVTPSLPSLSASHQFTRSSLHVTNGSIPSIVVPGLELAPRSVSSSKSYSPVSSSVIFDSLGQPFVSPNPLPVPDFDLRYAEYVLPISGVTTGNYHSPYSTHGLLPPEYDFRHRYLPLTQYGPCTVLRFSRC